MMVSPTPLLSLTLPLASLTDGPGLSEDFFATLAAQGLFQPLPNLSFGPRQNQQNIATYLDSECPLSDDIDDTPGGQRRSTHLPIPPRQIISLLDLLERMDNDMVKEVQRVRESIKEARADIEEYRNERSLRDNVVEQRKAREGRDTKDVDDEFWLQV